MRDVTKNLVKVRVVVLLPAYIVKACCSYAKKASEAGEVYFALDNENFIPHITLCRVEVQEEKINMIQKELEALFAKVKSFEISTKGFAVVDDGKNKNPDDDHSLYLDLVNTKVHRELRRKVFAIMKKYNHRDEYRKLSAIRPHVTLARFNNLETAQNAMKGLLYKPLKFKPEVVAFTNSEKFGQVSKVIKKYKLTS